VGGGGVDIKRLLWWVINVLLVSLLDIHITLTTNKEDNLILIFFTSVQLIISVSDPVSLRGRNCNKCLQVLHYLAFGWSLKYLVKVVDVSKSSRCLNNT
jgi:hypothetical protein